jgi:transcription factor CP2-like protein
MERYVRSNVYHSNKTSVSAATVAGLTVDLPSPDSGIGAEAVTPRDQTAIQQVGVPLNHTIYFILKGHISF